MTETPSLAAALAAFQAELPRIGKGNTADAGTYKYKYADLADVSSTVLPLLGKHGLSFSAKPMLDEAGKFVLEYTLRHSSGEQDGGRYPLPTGKPQDVGSAITYARRYALSAITGVAPDTDDDGASAPDVPDRHAEELAARRQAEETRQIEQAATYDLFTEEIQGAEDPAIIGEIGSRVRTAKGAGRITANQYDRLGRRAVARLGELKPVEVAS